MTTTMYETWPKQALALYYVDMKDDDDDGVLFYTYENKKKKGEKEELNLLFVIMTLHANVNTFIMSFQMCQAEACLDVSSPSCLFIQGSDTREGCF